MKRALGIIALALCVAVLAPPVGAQAPKSAITGTTPFTLGMATADAKTADPTLSAVSAPICGAAPHGTAYASHVTTPIGGYPFVATLILCFSDDKLGAIALTWPHGTFHEDIARWQVAIKALAAQLVAAYGPTLVRRYAVDEDMGGVLEMADSQGNLLTMRADPGGDPDILLTYMSSDYDQAVHGKRVTVTSY